MQTKSQIRRLFASSGVRANKRLGQNFLIDLNLMRFLVDTADIKQSDSVLEVGCATGSLTELLAGRAGRVIAVEIDSRLAEIAGEQLSGLDNVEIVNVDILESKHQISGVVLDKLGGGDGGKPVRFQLVANLAYNIASPVMLNLVVGEVFAERMYVTVQKEVAERMKALQTDKQYGTLSIILSATGEVRMIKVLKPDVFWPRPEVDSAIVSFVRDEAKVGRIKDMGLFCEIVRFFMSHRRKMLKSCFRFAAGRLCEIDNWAGIFESCQIESTQRPEQVEPAGYVAIANEVFLRTAIN